MTKITLQNFELLDTATGAALRFGMLPSAVAQLPTLRLLLGPLVATGDTVDVSGPIEPAWWDVFDHGWCSFAAEVPDP